MKIEHLHDWNLSPSEARALQKELAGTLDTTSPLPPWQTLAAADVSYNKFSEWLYAAVVVVRAGTFELVERVGVVARAEFPYITGLLSFRECPPVLEAFRKLSVTPDVVLCDGQGTAHPRRMGLACHLGLWLGVPTVGCAKSWLCGEYDEPGPDRGDRSPMVDRGEVVGARSDALAGQTVIRLAGPPVQFGRGHRRRPGVYGEVPPHHPRTDGPRLCERDAPRGGRGKCDRALTTKSRRRRLRRRGKCGLGRPFHRNFRGTLDWPLSAPKGRQCVARGASPWDTAPREGPPAPKGRQSVSPDRTGTSASAAPSGLERRHADRTIPGAWRPAIDCRPFGAGRHRPDSL